MSEATANIETAKKDKQAAEMELLVANANLKSIQSAYQAAVAKRDRYQSVGTAGAISQNQVEEAKLSAEQQLQSIAAQQATIAKQQQTIARLQQIIVSTQARSTRTQVALADIGKVTVGQTVQMRVSACPYTENGVLTGKVIDVAADTKSSDKNAATPSANIYEVTIAPSTTSIGTRKNTCQMRSGMEGRVDIITKEETVFNFMLNKARLLVNP